ncbi:MAG TPA: 3-phosphoglycerate dehydrogenase [Candidatus Onthocola gallistercoris]|uniref:3-phosphoglycerate dehydrogenase n=1 Tax=Candidatus Onthocola gallistercoris TaxID=2840876 RepID=A0A9D1HGV0_9FIRM|nr:3-phosphoglycerate dehydrogenase [Candidatus Onthocola gallistercoris]
MYKVNCLNPIAAVGLNNLTSDYVKTDDFSEANVALVRSAAMHDLDLPDSLLAVARAGAGVNNIPLDKCAEKGIVVFNTPGANANGVKELVLAGALLACRDIVGGIEWVKANKDDENISKSVEKAKKAFAGSEILGKTMGVIGLGAIGILVANACDALGMNVIGYDPFLSDAQKSKLNSGIKTVTDLADMYKDVNFVTIHVPALPSTIGMLNKDAFDQMPDGTVILNFSRDTLVNEDDIEAALKSGKVRKYVTDFANPRVTHMDGVIVTPHLGASTAESEDNCAIMAVKEIRDFIENGNIKNSVNYPNTDLGTPAGAGRVAICAKAGSSVAEKLSAIVGDVAGMTSNTRGDWMYVLADTTAAVSEDAVKAIEAVDGVVRVRVVK